MKNLMLIFISVLLLIAPKMEAQDAPNSSLTLTLSPMNVNVDGDYITVDYTILGAGEVSGITVLYSGSDVHLKQSVVAGDRILVTFKATPEEYNNGDAYFYHFDCKVFNADGEDEDGCDVPIEGGASSGY